MIAASLSAGKLGGGTFPNSVTPATPSTEAIAKQLGIDTTSEPYLMHVVSEMRNAPLPPTWTAVVSAVTDKIRSTQSPPRGGVDAPGLSLTPPSAAAAALPVSIEYVNRVTGERTSRHPGTSYFMAAVESERNRQKGCGRSPPGTDFFVGSLHQQSTGSLQQSTQHNEHEHQHTAGSIISSVKSKSMNDITEGGTDWDIHSTSDAHTHSSSTAAAEDEKTAASAPKSPKGEVEGAAPTPCKRAATKRGKRCRRAIPPPKWLNFTSWWHETTTSGSLNSMDRKHASIRYETASDTFEVELQDVPAIFEVSHATGRHGRVGTIDLHVGAQISILGRQMRLMQCDGLTAQWLESEVRLMSKAKASLISALEREGDYIRVRCRSDRLEASASAMRGGASVGSAASIDRRCLMQDVIVLRDTLAETQPDEARRLSEGIL